MLRFAEHLIPEFLNTIEAERNMFGSGGLNRLRKAAQTLAASPLSPAKLSGGSTNPLLNFLFPALSTPPPFVGQAIRSIGIKTFEIPDNKRIEVALQHIHGIGRRKAHQILCELCIENKPARQLTPRERFTLGEEIFRHLIDRELKQFNKNAVERLKQIGCYRGMRHSCGLPCRGQRTHTNARTLKGRGISVPSKKKA